MLWGQSPQTFWRIPPKIYVLDNSPHAGPHTKSSRPEREALLEGTKECVGNLDYCRPKSNRKHWLCTYYQNIRRIFSLTWFGYQFVTKWELLKRMSGKYEQMSDERFRTSFDRGGHTFKVLYCMCLHGFIFMLVAQAQANAFPRPLRAFISEWASVLIEICERFFSQEQIAGSSHNNTLDDQLLLPSKSSKGLKIIASFAIRLFGSAKFALEWAAKFDEFSRNSA